MSEERKRRLAEALDQWASTVDSLRARERSAANAQVEEIEKERLIKAFLSSALGKHLSMESENS